MARAVRQAPAKVNLWLRIVGRRSDGYHLLDSLVAFVELADRIEVEVWDEDELVIDGPFAGALASESDNIVLRAVRAMSAGTPATPLSIHLTKNIPVAAGLGGGSSDAAAMLQALDELWPSKRDLRGVAASLGADVPVCLAAQPVRMGGIGDQLLSAGKLPPCSVVLVNPGKKLPTSDVFRAYAAACDKFSEDVGMPARFADLPSLAASVAACGNDLTAPACLLMPEIAVVLQELRRYPAVSVAAMSGSGATCFGLLADKAEAAHIAEAILRKHPTWWVWSGRLRQA